MSERDITRRIAIGIVATGLLGAACDPRPKKASPAPSLLPLDRQDAVSTTRAYNLRTATPTPPQVSTLPSRPTSMPNNESQNGQAAPGTIDVGYIHLPDGSDYSRDEANSLLPAKTPFVPR